MAAEGGHAPRRGDATGASEPPPVIASLQRRGALAAVMATYSVFAVGRVLYDIPFSYDEATYGARTRALERGTSWSGFWGDYRAPGLPLLTRYLPGPSTEVGYRLVVVACGAAALWLTWWIAKRLFDDATALAATVILALTGRYLSIATQFLPDVPGAMLGLASIALFLRYLESERRWRYALLTLALALAATYVRYGAPVPILCGFVGICVARWPDVRRAPFAPGLVVAATAMAMASVLFLPALSGGELSPVQANEQIESFATDKLATVRQMGAQASSWFGIARFPPRSLFGIAGVVLFGVYMFGSANAVRAVVRRRSINRSVVASAVIAGLTLAGLLGALSHSEARYLTPAIPWIAMIAGYGIRLALGRVSPVTGKAVVAVLIVAGLLGLSGVIARSPQRRREVQRKYVDAVKVIAPPAPCLILTDFQAPRFAWSTPCEVQRLPLDSNEFADRLRNTPADTHVVAIADKDSGPAKDGVLRSTGVTPSIVDSNAEGTTNVRVYRIR